MPRGDAALAASVLSATAYLNAYRLTALCTGPSPARAIRMFRRWSHQTCRRLGIEIRIAGDRPAGNWLFVANHRSYLDILVLAAALDVTFLARDDVSSWRLIGPTARAMGAVFVDRNVLQTRVRAARSLARRLCDASVVVFPEGTTGGTTLPGTFQPGLFRLLHRLQAGVVPVTLRYSRRSAYWVDDVGVDTHVRQQVLHGSPLVASVHIGTPLAPAANGSALCRRTYDTVAAPIEQFGEFVGPA